MKPNRTTTGLLLLVVHGGGRVPAGVHAGETGRAVPAGAGRGTGLDHGLFQRGRRRGGHLARADVVDSGPSVVALPGESRSPPTARQEPERAVGRRERSRDRREPGHRVGLPGRSRDGRTAPRTGAADSPARAETRAADAGDRRVRDRLERQVVAAQRTGRPRRVCDRRAGRHHAAAQRDPVAGDRSRAAGRHARVGRSARSGARGSVGRRGRERRPGAAGRRRAAARLGVPAAAPALRHGETRAAVPQQGRLVRAGREAAAARSADEPGARAGRREGCRARPFVADQAAARASVARRRGSGRAGRCARPTSRRWPIA